MSTTPKTKKIQTPIATATKRVKRLVKKALIEKARAGAHYHNADAALERARAAGLQPGQAIEIELPDAGGKLEKQLFMIQDNFAGESAFRNTRIPHFELKKVPAFKRVANEPSVEAAVPAAK